MKAHKNGNSTLLAMLKTVLLLSFEISEVYIADEIPQRGELE